MEASVAAARTGAADSVLSKILPGLLYAGVASLIIAAFLCAMYTITISVRAFFPVEDKDLYKNSTVKEAGPLMLVPIYIFCVCNIVFGMWPGPILAILTAIGEGRL